MSSIFRDPGSERGGRLAGMLVEPVAHQHEELGDPAGVTPPARW
jgi:hypothetical protein